MRRSGVVALPIRHSHALQVAELPPRHRDPFDRMLIAQAQLENLAIVTPSAPTPYLCSHCD
ncbi:PIN domain-containing protein [Mycobacterium sp. 4D054]|uniref:PIN domain-containing protein n=1 Tax=unclassified Mycobacterium TaxID=2642494 RepID=UPI0037C5BD66